MKNSEIMKIDRNHQNKDKLISFTLCLLVGFNSITFFINVIFNFFVSANFIYDTLLLYIMLSLLMIACFSKIKKIKIDQLVFIFIVIVLYLVSYLFYPQNRHYMFTSIIDYKTNAFYYLFFLSFPTYILIRNIHDFKIFRDILYKFSLFILLTSDLLYILLIKNKEVNLQYMVFSYNMLFSLCYLIYEFTQNKRVIELFIILISFLVMFVAGARGPVVCLFSYLLFLTLTNVKDSIKKRSSRLLIGIVILTLTIVVVNFNYILNLSNYFLNKQGIESRTISIILSGNSLDDSGRSKIQDVIINDFNKSCLMGNGMFGDRAVAGTYPHNFILEIISQYGIVLGSCFLIIILHLALTALKKSKNKLMRNLLVLCIPCGIVKLLLSGSYLNEPYLYLMLGMCVNIIKYEAKSSRVYEESKVKNKFKNEIFNNANKSYRLKD